MAIPSPNSDYPTTRNKPTAPAYLSMDLSGIPVLLSSDPLWFSYLECNRVLLKLLLILQAIDINSGQFPGTASEQKVPADPLYCTCIVC